VEQPAERPDEDLLVAGRYHQGAARQLFHQH
jgi:hypothetical protein